MAKNKKSINSKSVKLPQQSKVQSVASDSIDDIAKIIDGEVSQEPEKDMLVDDIAEAREKKKSKAKTSKKKTKTKTATFIPVDMSMSNVDSSKQDIDDEKIVDADMSVESSDVSVEGDNDTLAAEEVTTVLEDLNIANNEISSIETSADEKDETVELDSQEIPSDEKQDDLEKDVLVSETEVAVDTLTSIEDEVSYDVTETEVEITEQTEVELTKDSDENADIEEETKNEEQSSKKKSKSHDKKPKKSTKSITEGTLESDDEQMTEETDKLHSSDSTQVQEQKTKSNSMMIIAILLLLVVGAASVYIVQNQPSQGDFNRDVVEYNHNVNDLDLEALKINLQNPEFGFEQVDYDTVNNFSYFVKESDVPGYYIFVQFGQNLSFHLKNNVDLFVSDKIDEVETITIQSNNLYYKSFSIVDDSLVSIEILFDPTTLEVVKYNFSDYITEDLETIMTNKDISNKLNFTISTYMELMEQLR